MGLTNLISSDKIIALDTNIFIYAIDKPGPRGDLARSVLERIRTFHPKVSLSVLVIEEFFIQVYKQKREKETPFILDFLTIGGLATIVEISTQIAMKAAKIRAEYSSIRTPDALHLASSLEAGADVFVTTDRRIPRGLDKMKVEVLS